MILVDFLQALILAFSAVFLMEMGDKTQLTAFALSMQYRSPMRVFLGVLTGLTGVTIIAVTLGIILKSTLDFQILKPFVSILFMLSGLIILVNEVRNQNNGKIRICPVSLNLCDKPRENCSEIESCELYFDETVRKGAYIRSTAFMFFAELGDKTMVMSLGLATQFDPIGVFFGALFALTVVNGVGIIIGDRITKRIPRNIIGIISGIVFLITGFIILIF